MFCQTSTRDGALSHKPTLKAAVASKDGTTVVTAEPSSISRVITTATAEQVLYLIPPSFTS